jgi:hypothetical protein
MIVCDDHFLNDVLMLKTMLQIFEKRIIRIFRLRSISWIVFFLSFKRKARDVCVCVDVCVRRKRMRMKNVAFEKKISFVEFRDFFLLKSIFKLIIRLFVNIKRERKSLFRWQNSKIRVYICVSLQATKSSFYSLLYSFKLQIILSYFNLLRCFTF